MRLLIVEDEVMVGRHLRRLLTEVAGEQLENIHLVQTLAEAEAYLKIHQIDILFLDLKLSGDDGFDLLDEFTAGSFETIIVSANTDQAIRAFDHGVVDFVGKPFTQERLIKALQRAQASEVVVGAGQGQAKFLSVRHLGKTWVLSTSDITHIQSEGRYAKLITVDNKSFLHEKQLKQLIVVLPDQFHRIHKSHLVNLAFAQAIISRPGSKYALCMHDGSNLAIGRTYLSSLRSRLA